MVGSVLVGMMMLASNDWLEKGLFADNVGWLSLFGQEIARLSIFSPMALIIFISAIIIVLYFYKTTEWMTKRKLLIALAAIGVLAVAGSILERQRDRAPAVKFRLMMLPVESDAAVADSRWMAEALWQMTGQQLHRAVVDQAIIVPVDWIPSSVTSDSLTKANRSARLQQLFQVDYLLLGRAIGAPSNPAICYQLIHLQAGSVVRSDTLPLIPQRFPAIVIAICDSILNYFRLEPRWNDRAIRYASLQNYQQFLAATELYRDQNLSLAKEQIELVIARDSSFVEALILAGKIHFSMAVANKDHGEITADEFELAKHWFNRALAKDSSCAEARLYLGEYYIYQQRWSLAEQMLLRAYHLQPNEPRLYLSLSRLHPSRYRHLGFKDERQLFERAIFFNPSYEDAYLMLADYYLFENQREQAIRVLKRLLEINPNSVPGLMALGKIYLVRNDIVNIIDIFNRVLQLNPQNADAYYNLGILYYNSEDYETAEQLLKRAIAINNHPNAHLYLAYLYEARGELPLAIEHLRERIRLRKGLDDEFAEAARKHLFALLHSDSAKMRDSKIEK